jgi:hypothetical protein
MEHDALEGVAAGGGAAAAATAAVASCGIARRHLSEAMTNRISRQFERGLEEIGDSMALVGFPGHRNSTSQRLRAGMDSGSAGAVGGRCAENAVGAREQRALVV